MRTDLSQHEVGGGLIMSNRAQNVLKNNKIGLFGQAGSAQSELKNNDVGIGDLFLFFGWFKKTENPKIDIHKIFGWLQIEEILEGDKQISNFLKKHNLSHPHDPKYRKYKNNTIYVSRKNFGLFKKFSKGKNFN